MLPNINQSGLNAKELKREPVRLDRWQLEAKHSAALVTDTSITKYAITWHPEYWLLVARLTAGNILLYPNADRSSMGIRITSGSIRLPVDSDVVTVETVGASGIYDLYAVKGLDRFEVTS